MEMKWVLLSGTTVTITNNNNSRRMIFESKLTNLLLSDRWWFEVGVGFVSLSKDVTTRVGQLPRALSHEQLQITETSLCPPDPSLNCAEIWPADPSILTRLRPPNQICSIRSDYRIFYSLHFFFKPPVKNIKTLIFIRSNCKKKNYIIK